MVSTGCIRGIAAAAILSLALLYWIDGLDMLAVLTGQASGMVSLALLYWIDGLDIKYGDVFTLLPQCRWPCCIG